MSKVYLEFYMDKPYLRDEDLVPWYRSGARLPLTSSILRPVDNGLKVSPSHNKIRLISELIIVGDDAIRNAVAWTP